MKRKLLGIFLALAMVAAIAIPSAVSAAQPGTGITGSGTVEVTYAPLTFSTGLTDSQGNLTGTFPTFKIITEVSGAVATTHTLVLTGTTSTGLAASTSGYAFTLTSNSTQTTTLETYFAAKSGWTNDMKTQMNSEITGATPFFYLTYDGSSSYSLVDAFKQYLGSSYSPYLLTVDDDYPVGTYTYTGTLTGTADTGTASKLVTITLQVIRNYSYTVVSPVTFTATSSPVRVNSSFTLTGTTTVTNTGATSITGYTLGSFTFNPGSGASMTVNSGTAVGTSSISTGGIDTVTFTIQCTAGVTAGTINLSGLTFTFTPQP